MTALDEALADVAKLTANVRALADRVRALGDWELLQLAHRAGLAMTPGEAQRASPPPVTRREHTKLDALEGAGAQPEPDADEEVPERGPRPRRYRLASGDQTRSAIQRALASHPAGLTVTELAAETGLRESTLRSALPMLARKEGSYRKRWRLRT